MQFREKKEKKYGRNDKSQVFGDGRIRKIHPTYQNEMPSPNQSEHNGSKVNKMP